MLTRDKLLIYYSLSGIALGSVTMLMADPLWKEAIAFVGIIIFIALISAISNRN